MLSSKCRSDPQELFDRSQRLAEELFSSETKYMITEVTSNLFEGAPYFFLKGTPEIVLGMSGCFRARTRAHPGRRWTNGREKACACWVWLSGGMASWKIIAAIPGLDCSAWRAPVRERRTRRHPGG